MLSESQLRDKMSGVLLGIALGDALGFITEGMQQDNVKRKFGKVKRFYVLGDRGFVTDDTEQSALIAESIVRYPDDLPFCVQHFRRAMVMWFACMPFGIGRATSKACTRIALGVRKSGVQSAGNGAAMRAAPIGAYFYDQPELRVQYGVELAQSTHFDQSAVDGALFVAELASICITKPDEKSLDSCFNDAIKVVGEPNLCAALEKAADMARRSIDLEVAASELNRKPGAYILNSLPFSTYSFLRNGNGDILECLASTIGGGGDTDTNAAMVGAWLGALHGASKLPSELIAKIDDGPFGPSHLRRLAHSMVDSKLARKASIPNYSLLHSALRNIALIPVILTHAVIRFLPISSAQ